jgi:hypothetical protein
MQPGPLRCLCPCPRRDPRSVRFVPRALSDRMDSGSGLAYPVLMGDARVFVAEAEIALKAEGDPAAVGAAVTVELCGHWEHEESCRWPHNNAICPGPKLNTFRTLLVAELSEEEMVRERIGAALRACGDWQVVSLRARPVGQHEEALAERLLAAPRLPQPR